MVQANEVGVSGRQTPWQSILHDLDIPEQMKLDFIAEIQVLRREEDATDFPEDKGPHLEGGANVSQKLPEGQGLD